MGWLRIEGLMAEVPDKAVFGDDRKDTVIDIAELFLAHGADPRQVRNNTLQAALSARGSAIATGKPMPVMPSGKEGARKHTQIIPSHQCLSLNQL